MRKYIFTFAFLLLFTRVQAMELSAQSAILIDVDSGRVLYSKNAAQPLPMASTTKIMTALIAIECGNADDVVTVSQNAAYQEGSSMYLKVEEKVTLRELLYGLMLSSGNDAAVAIAEHIAGDVASFAEMMTQKAKDIGAFQTGFITPNGLDAEGHVTTAADLAKITAEAFRNPLFAEIVRTKRITLDRGTYINHNKLLDMYEGCVGVKTGFTKKSGRCLVSAADRNGFSLVAVTLNAPDDWNDHIRLFDMAYSVYQQVTPVTQGYEFGDVGLLDGGKIKLVYGSSLSFYLSMEEQKELEMVSEVPPVLEAPLKKGQPVGFVSAYLKGALMGRAEILCGEDVEKEKDDFITVLRAMAINWLKAFR